ncbi:MAG TPA: GNAT family N-acetyltransferase [Candidatus Kapabacteria bacterium]|nr:GNAT family N-acetyltransferase [Candidatus Kapabacteria bacterium]
MRIRLAREEDYVALARLHRTTIRRVNSKEYAPDIIRVWSSKKSAKRFRDSAPLCKRWVAVEKGKLVGFCDHNLTGELWGLYVHKDHLGTGVGSRLLKKAEESMKKLGWKEVRLKSTITAKDFYRKHGYLVIRKALHDIRGTKVPVYIMKKNLT